MAARQALMDAALASAEAVIHSNVMIHPGIRPDSKIRDAALRTEKGTSGGEGEKKIAS